MDTFYDAFISYRHCPRDSAVAKEIHGRLEKFRVPGAVKKRTGKQRIGRIFRDKEELPLTSNLTKNITDALKNSNYLIVICSEHTKESMWVDKEIETFLETHPIDHVLTVLSEGELPESIIPPRLFNYRETNEENTSADIVYFEPLSCDWRIPHHQAVISELPRLAAVLLGCSYDELIRRAARYRAQKLTIILTSALIAMAALTIYYIRTNAEIQRNYDKALSNQSIYLASVSDKLMNNGDRLTAIKLAIQALPGKNNARPYIAEAQYALSKSVLEYLTPDSAYVPYPVGAFVPEGMPDDFKVNTDGSLLVIRDYNDVLSVWDTNSFQNIAFIRMPADDSIVDYEVTEDNRLFVWSVSQVFCYALNDGALIWDYANVENVFISPDFETVYCLTNEGGRLGVYGMVILDGKTGSARDRITLPESEFIYSDTYTVRGAFSYDGTKLAIVNSLMEIGSVHIVCVDLKSFEFTVLNLGENIDVYDLCFPDSNTVAALFTPNRSHFSNSVVNSTIQYTVPYTAVVYELENQEVRWSYEFPVYGEDFSGEIGYSADGGYIQIVAANKILFLDPASGEIIARTEAESPICHVRDNWYIDVDGNLCNYYFDEDSLSSVAVLPGNLSHVEACPSILYALQDFSGQVIKYSIDACDDSWLQWGDTYGLHFSAAAHCENSFALLCDNILFLYSITEGRLVSTTDLSSYQDYLNADFFGFGNDDNLYILLSSGTLLTVDPANAAVTSVELSDKCGDKNYSAWLSDSEKIFYSYSDQNSCISLCIYNADTDEFSEYTIDVPCDSGRIGTAAFTEDSAFLTIASQDDVSCAPCIIDLASGKTTLIDCPDLVLENPKTAWSEDGRILAIVCQNAVCLISKDGSVIRNIPLVNTQPERICFSPDGDYILLLYAEAGVYRYKISGEYDNMAQLSPVTLPLSNDVSWMFEDDNELALRIGTTLYFIDWEQWRLTASVESCLDYLSDEQLIVTRNAESCVGCFHHHSLEELLQMGTDIVGDWEMRADVLSTYGLAGFEVDSSGNDRDIF